MSTERLGDFPKVPASEAELIERYLLTAGAERSDVILGIGDDAALLRAPTDQQLVVTTDALIEGAHFLPGAPARSLGHRALAVNLSDLAAMGAEPAWALASLVLPEADENWLREFAAGFGALARSAGVALVGGNLARGPLSITVQLTGFAPPGSALRRSGGQPGDWLFVSGTLGDARAGRLFGTGAAGAAAQRQAQRQWLRERFEYPSPRTALGLGLRGVASACLDLSDGLLVDLPRLTAASGCAAQLRITELPLSPALQALCGAQAWQQALQGGEDYELLFSVPPANLPAVAALARRLELPLSACGELRAGSGIELLGGSGVIQFSASSFDHFAATL
jgi:thiamine-monophosphate kinase